MRFPVRDVHIWFHDADEKFDESKHPRGQPENAGEFTSGKSSGSTKSAATPVLAKRGTTQSEQKVHEIATKTDLSNEEKIAQIEKLSAPFSPDSRTAQHAKKWLSYLKEGKLDNTPTPPYTEMVPKLSPEPEPPQSSAAPESGKLPSDAASIAQSVANKTSKLDDEDFYRVTGVRVSGDGANKSRIKLAVASLPPSIRAEMQTLGLRVQAVKSIAHGSTDQHSYSGLYHPGLNLIEIPDSYLIRGSPQRLKDPEGVTVHEIGHALDAKSGGALNRKFAALVDKGATSLSKFDREYAAHFFKNEKEKFAELFRLTFSGKTAFEKSKKAADVTFAEGTAALRSHYGVSVPP